MHLLRLIYESFSFAFGSLAANKLRTLLSLLGITIGIFAIISVFTIVDSLEVSLTNSINSIGNDLVYIQKWPWRLEEGATEYPFWKYQNRPNPKIEELEKIRRRGNSIQYAAFHFSFKRTVLSGNDKIENATILATSFGLYDLWNLKISKGRYFTENEMHSGAPVTIIGAEIAEQLFNKKNPIGQILKIQGYKFRIIGVYDKMGRDIFHISRSMDNYIHISAKKSANLIDIRNNDQGQTISVKASPYIDSDEFLSELKGIMRSIRKLKPLEKDDFALNEVRFISEQVKPAFKSINTAGAIIGGFSILVGGFGIANIMFVSVKERTKIIGIQKSLGAKRYFILLQFIFEAIVLSLIGGVVGLVLIFIGTLIVSYTTEFTIILTVGNIIKGILISSIIGFIAGFMPARSAAKLDPVEAINSI